MPSLDELFGELRSLMQLDYTPSHWDVRKVIEPAYALDPARYTDEWLPYLRQQELGYFFASDLDEVTLLSALLPEGTRLVLIIDDPRFSCAAMAEAPQTARLTGITVEYKYEMSASRFESMMSSPYLGAVVNLDIGGNIMGDRAMAALADATSLHGLEYLRLYHNEIGPDGARALAQSPHVSELRELDLSVNAIRCEGLAALGESPYLGKLEKLNVGHNKIKRAGAEGFAQTTTLVSLKSLILQQNSIGNYGALALANCAALSSLTTLQIGRNRINDKGLGYIRSSEHLTSLESLYTR